MSSLAQQMIDVAYAKGCGRLSYRQLKEVLATTASSFAAPPIPTGFSFALAGDHSVINVSWTGMPATVVKTELWTSTDNVTFALEATINAPATSTTSPIALAGITKYGKIRWCNASVCGSFTPSQSAGPVWPLTESWETRAIANGGTVSAGTRTAVQSFEASIVSISSQIMAMLIVAPDHIKTALTPFIKTFGTDPWVEAVHPVQTFNTCGMLDNGVPQDVHLTTGVASNQFALGHIGISVYWKNGGSAAGNVFDVGEYNGGASTNAYALQLSFTGNVISANLGGGDTTGSSAPQGFVSVERTSTTQMDYYFLNSGQPVLTSLGSFATAAIPDGRSAREFFIFSLNNQGNSSGSSQNRSLGLIAFTTGLSAADCQILGTAVQTMRTAFGCFV